MSNQATLAWLVGYAIGVLITVLALVEIVKTDEKDVRAFMITLTIPLGVLIAFISGIALTKVGDATTSTLAIASLVTVGIALGFTLARPPS